MALGRRLFRAVSEQGRKRKPSLRSIAVSWMVEVWDQVDFSGRLAKSLGKAAMMVLRRPTLVGAGMVAATRPLGPPSDAFQNGDYADF